MAYTTRSAVKLYLGIENSVTDDDALIDAFLLSAQETIDLYFLRSFEALSDTTRYFDGISDVRGRRLVFDRDICQLTSIVNGDGVTVTSGQYITLPPNVTPYYGVQLLSSAGISWAWVDDSENAIAVTGRWAYSLTAPSSVASLCRWLTAAMYRGKDNVLESGEGASVAAAMDILAGDLPPDIRILMNFIPRRIDFGW